MMISAEIVSTGTELLLGQSINTNARYLSERLAALGICCYFQTTVGDNPDRIRQVLENAMSRADLIITTGGLGPTMDDLTKEVVAELCGRSLQLHEPTLHHIESFFQRRDRIMPDNNKRQALIPEGSIIIPNHLGTAPGVILEEGTKTFVLLPGPPSEMEPMFEETVKPYLTMKTEIDPGLLHSRVLKVVGPGESVVEEKLRDLLLQQSNPTIALLAKQRGLHIRLTARAKTKVDAEALIKVTEAKIVKRLHPYIYGFDQETLSGVVGQCLLQRGKKLALAESCTGGLIAHEITNEAGSSAYFLLGVTAYDNSAKKELLGVEEKILQTYGAVSAETALAMAQGVQKISGASIAMAVTGIAGPDGGTAEKPVGLVYGALVDGAYCETKEFRFVGDRKAIKERTATAVLNWLRYHLQESS
ncbi:competence/damage-inducible protein A [Heliorestis convoluta]|uniref:Putative competence-damage inducible protein n=1 Tax=Heliorestis convoluta TaxID=356322 RepID=A0A5Q2MZL4_9FIRM|nr:competence/damage-inducible protein A [Heliorestis convoluta]QGG46919.1 competence/damage-inducible protein CinA [Heliorestis convoluta]